MRLKGIGKRHMDGSHKSKTAGKRLESSPSDPLEEIQVYRAQRVRSRTLSHRKPTPNPEAFARTEKKRQHNDEYLQAPPSTPMKRSQSDEVRTQKERFEAELDNRYPIRLTIAQTKTSFIYRAMEQNTNIIYALKQLNPIYIKTKEAQAAAKLEFKHAYELRDHPNIVRYDTYWHYGPYICFQLEYLPGGSLEALLQKSPIHDPQTNREQDIFWYFFLDIVMGLRYIHQHKLVHLDIKPANIFLSGHVRNNIPSLKIGDFGLSRKLGSKNLGKKFKKGDGRYLAPELLDKSAPITYLVDIYSLGISLLEMASDYCATDILWEEVKRGSVPYENKVSPDLARLLRRMLCPPDYRITAEACLLTCDKLRHKADELGISLTLSEFVTSSDDQMEDIEEECLCSDIENSDEQFFDDNLQNTPPQKQNFDTIKKRLF